MSYWKKESICTEELDKEGYIYKGKEKAFEWSLATELSSKSSKVIGKFFKMLR